MKYAKGIMWLDDCRIPFVNEGDKTINHNTQPGSFVGSFGSSETIYVENIKGRFTPNLLVCDDMLNDGSVSKNGDIKPHKQKEKTCFFTSEYVTSSFVSDKGTNSRYYDLDKWFDKLIQQL